MSSRPEYQTDARFSANELALDQQYRWQHGREHNRFAHGWGVVCGLKVVSANDPPKGWTVRICPGYAISPCGDEIEVRRSLVINVSEWLWSLRTPEGLPSVTALVAIWSATRDETLQSAADRVCISRIVDDVRIDILSDRDVNFPRVDLCQGFMSTYDAPSPLAPYVPLARLALPTVPTGILQLIDL